MSKQQKPDINSSEEGKPARKKTAPKKSRILEKSRTDEQDIEPGMTVETTEGDLGEADISKPKVKEVVEDEGGKVEKIVVNKGVVFQKKLDIPADRVRAVEREAEDNGSAGKVIVAATEEETESLTAVGEEGLLDKVEQKIPTAEGLREREGSSVASTSYGVAGTFGWPAGLSKKPWQSEGFYLILTVAMLISLVVALLRFDPIQLMFWANVLNGVLSPVLVIYLLFVGNYRKIMRNRRMSWITNTGLVLTAIVMFAAAALLFYGLATGQGG